MCGSLQDNTIDFNACLGAIEREGHHPIFILNLTDYQGPKEWFFRSTRTLDLQITSKGVKVTEVLLDNSIV